MKFKNLDESIYSDGYYYDIFEGYINPKEMLEDEEDINKVEDAITTIQDFLSEAESTGILKSC